MEDYRRIADAVATDIASGRLRAGDQLPPQRRFARQHNIASSTAARVYRELVRRGLATGEVGRGTFVRAATPGAEPALAEPADNSRVDLELNFPVLPDQPAMLGQALARLDFAAALRPVGAAGSPQARDAAASLLSRAEWTPQADHILFAGNGRQAIAAAISAVVPVGERLGVEAMTYPVVKGIASRLGVTLVPLPTDDKGLTPDGLRAAGLLRAIYVQPSIHNPLGITMDTARRAEIARVLAERHMVAIEDSIYAFLHAAPLSPLAALAPEQVILVDSLSKRLAPGLTLGILAPPPAWTARVAAALRAGGWAAGGVALAAGTAWISDGTAATIEEAKRHDADARQGIMRQSLAGFDVQADPAAYHCWWRLPDPWRADTFVAAAARHGIAVTPAAAFTVGSGHAPNAVRLALSTPPVGVLAFALDTLAALARSSPEDTGVD